MSYKPKRGVLIQGKGTQTLTLTFGALCVINSNGKYLVSFSDKSRPFKLVKLPDHVDTITVSADEDVTWSVEWFVCKPSGESLDRTPIAIPLGMGKPESLQDTIARLVRRQIDVIAEKEGFDLAEEEDFDPEDEDAPTPYEFERIAAKAEMERARMKSLKAHIAAKKEAYLEQQAKRAKPAENSPPAEPVVKQA